MSPLVHFRCIGTAVACMHNSDCCNSLYPQQLGPKNCCTGTLPKTGRCLREAVRARGSGRCRSPAGAHTPSACVWQCSTQSALVRLQLRLWLSRPPPYPVSVQHVGGPLVFIYATTLKELSCRPHAGVETRAEPRAICYTNMIHPFLRTFPMVFHCVRATVQLRVYKVAIYVCHMHV